MDGDQIHGKWIAILKILKRTSRVQMALAIALSVSKTACSAVPRTTVQIVYHRTQPFGVKILNNNVTKIVFC